jgi:hypothetical protein
MTVSTSQLLDEFEASVKGEFQNFITERGAVYNSGFSQFEGNPRRLKKRGAKIPSIFWFICRFQFPSVVLDIGYGDREFIVEPELYYPQIDRYIYPTFLVEAASRNKEKGLGGNTFVLDLGFMKRTVQELATAITSTWDILESPSGEIFDRVQVILGKKMIFDQEMQRKKDRERDSIIASKSFHEGDYEQVICLLSPYQNDQDLSVATRKILKMAYKYKDKKGEQKH